MCSCCHFLPPCSQSTLSLGEGAAGQSQKSLPDEDCKSSVLGQGALARGLGKAEPNSGWLCEVAFGDRKPEKAGHLMTFTHVGFCEEQQEESGSHNSGRISRNLVSSRRLLHQSQGVDFHRFS